MRTNYGSVALVFGSISIFVSAIIAGLVSLINLLMPNIASLISIIGWLIIGVAIIFGIIGIVMDERKEKAITGLILGIIGLIIGIIFSTLFTTLLGG